MFNGKTILVTDGIGSFGRRVATGLERYKPRRLVVCSRPATATCAMDHEL
jgi:FlaA1/EpsC-like NDP-sugar epimerase